MNSQKIFFALSAAAFGALTAFGGRTFYISPTSQGTLPTGWNKCPFVISKSQPKLFTDLIDSEGNATDVKLFLMIPATANYPNSTRPFTGEAAEFEPMRSVVNNQSVCSTDPKVSDLGLAESCIRARFEGLDPTKLYAFTFAAQRADGNVDELSARYTVNGANSGAIVMNAHNCTNRVAVLPGIAPLPDGSIEFSVEAAESNTYWKRFGYLTGLKLEEMDDLGTEEIYIDARIAPVSPTWTWNTVPMQTKASYRNLMDRNGNPTRVGIDVEEATGIGSNGNATLDLTGDAAEFNDARVGSNAQLYFNKTSHGRATVSGLYPNCTYSFTFVASRKDSDTSKIYTTKYTVTGANGGSSTLDARSNVSNVARVSGIRPTERGEAVIDIDPGDDCNVSWFYIMAFKITRETRYSSDMRAMTVDATAGGSVSATVDGMATNCACYLSADKTLVATATPDAGYRFVGWTSSFTNATVTANPFTISAAQSATWTAVFEQDSAYVRKTAYIDAHDTPANDGKTWNLFSDAKYGWNQMQGPLVASDGSTSAVALRTVLPFGLRRRAPHDSPVRHAQHGQRPASQQQRHRVRRHLHGRRGRVRGGTSRQQEPLHSDLRFGCRGQCHQPGRGRIRRRRPEAGASVHLPVRGGARRQRRARGPVPRHRTEPRDGQPRADGQLHGSGEGGGRATGRKRHDPP